MAEAYIVDAVRTAGGRRNGKLAGWHPANMGAEVLDALIERTNIDPGAIEDVILGCVTQAGEQAFALARNVVLASRTLSQIGAGGDDRSSMRQLSTGGPVRGPGRCVGHAGRCDRCRCREHEPCTDVLKHVISCPAGCWNGST